jgi:hypothetical protein
MAEAEPESLGGISVDLVINTETLDFDAVQAKIDQWLASYNPTVKVGIEPRTTEPTPAAKQGEAAVVGDATAATAGAAARVERRALAGITATIEQFEIAEGALEAVVERVNAALATVTVGTPGVTPAAQPPAAEPAPAAAPKRGRARAQREPAPATEPTVTVTPTPKERLTGGAKRVTTAVVTEPAPAPPVTAAVAEPALAEAPAERKPRLRAPVRYFMEGGAPRGMPPLPGIEPLRREFRAAAETNDEPRMRKLAVTMATELNRVQTGLAAGIPDATTAKQMRTVALAAAENTYNLIQTALGRYEKGLPMLGAGGRAAPSAPASTATTGAQVATIAATAMGITTSDLKKIGREGARRTRHPQGQAMAAEPPPGAAPPNLAEARAGADRFLQLVTAINAVQKGEPATDPDTGKALPPTQETMQSLRKRLSTLQAAPVAEAGPAPAAAAPTPTPTPHLERLPRTPRQQEIDERINDSRELRREVEGYPENTARQRKKKERILAEITADDKRLEAAEIVAAPPAEPVAAAPEAVAKPATRRGRGRKVAPAAEGAAPVAPMGAYTPAPTVLQPTGELGWGALFEHRRVTALPGEPPSQRELRKVLARALDAEARRRGGEREERAERGAEGWEAERKATAGILRGDRPRVGPDVGVAPQAKELLAAALVTERGEGAVPAPRANLLPGQRPGEQRRGLEELIETVRREGSAIDPRTGRQVPGKTTPAKIRNIRRWLRNLSSERPEVPASRVRDAGGGPRTFTRQEALARGGAERQFEGVEGTKIGGGANLTAPIRRGIPVGEGQRVTAREDIRNPATGVVVARGGEELTEQITTPEIKDLLEKWRRGRFGIPGEQKFHKVGYTPPGGRRVVREETEEEYQARREEKVRHRETFKVGGRTLTALDPVRYRQEALDLIVSRLKPTRGMTAKQALTQGPPEIQRDITLFKRLAGTPPYMPGKYLGARSGTLVMTGEVAQAAMTPRESAREANAVTREAIAQGRGPGYVGDALTAAQRTELRREALALPIFKDWEARVAALRERVRTLPARGVAPAPGVEEVESAPQAVGRFKAAARQMVRGPGEEKKRAGQLLPMLLEDLPGIHDEIRRREQDLAQPEGMATGPRIRHREPGSPAESRLRAEADVAEREYRELVGFPGKFKTIQKEDPNARAVAQKGGRGATQTVEAPVVGKKPEALRLRTTENLLGVATQAGLVGPRAPGESVGEWRGRFETISERVQTPKLLRKEILRRYQPRMAARERGVTGGAPPPFASQEELAARLDEVQRQAEERTELEFAPQVARAEAKRTATRSALAEATNARLGRVGGEVSARKAIVRDEAGNVQVINTATGKGVTIPAPTPVEPPAPIGPPPPRIIASRLQTAHEEAEQAAVGGAAGGVATAIGAVAGGMMAAEPRRPLAAEGPPGTPPPTAEAGGLAGGIHVVATIDNFQVLAGMLQAQPGTAAVLGAAEAKAPMGKRRRGEPVTDYADVEGAQEEERHRGVAFARSATVKERINYVRKVQEALPGATPAEIADLLGGAKAGWSATTVKTLLGGEPGGGGGGPGGGEPPPAEPGPTPAGYGAGFPKIRMQPTPRAAGAYPPQTRIPIVPVEPLGLQRQRATELRRAEREADVASRQNEQEFREEQRVQRRATVQRAANAQLMAMGITPEIEEQPRGRRILTEEDIQYRASLAYARRANPVRAISTAVGSLLTAGGQRRFEERIGTFQQAMQEQRAGGVELKRLENAQRYAQARTREIEKQRAMGAAPEQIKPVVLARRQAFEELGYRPGIGLRETRALVGAVGRGEAPAVREAETNLGTLAETTAKTEAALSPMSEVAGNLLKIGVGAAIGARAFQVITKTFDLVSSQISKAGGEIVDRLGGFASTATRVTTVLGEQVVAYQGNAKAVIAASAAQAGLSDVATKTVELALGPTAIAKGGAKVEAQTVDLLRATFAARAGQAPQGLYGGYGGVLGTPFLAEAMGGGKGFTEQLSGLVGGVAAAGTIQAQKYVGLTPLNQTLGTWPTGTFNEAGQTTAESAATRRAQEDLKFTAGNYTEALNRGAKYLGESSDQFEFEIVPAGSQLAKNMEDAGRKAGDGGNAASLAADGFVLVNKKNRDLAITSDQYKEAMLQAAQGMMLQTERQFRTQREQQLVAQRQAIDVRTTFQKQVAAPFQAGLGGLAAPQIAPEVGIFPAAQGRQTRGATGFDVAGAKLGKQAQDEINASLARTKGYQAEIIEYQNKGINQARQLVVETDGDVKAFDENVASARRLQVVMANIQKTIGTKQAKYDTDQWNNSIRLLNRSLADAKALATSGGGYRPGTQNLGAIQRQQWEVGRQQGALGLALSQRQITTQMAIAQFQAPGETGEMRAARQREQITEARIAQQQLNLEKRQYGLAGEAFGVETRRGVTDTTWARDLAVEGRETEKTVATLNKELTAAAGAQQKYLNDLNADFSGATSKFDQALGTATEYAGAFGKGLRIALEEMGYEFSFDRKRNKTTITAPEWMTNQEWMRGRGAGRAPEPSAGAPAGKPQQALGTVGLTRGVTDVGVMGEAGAEVYAILRAPRGISGFGGGGSVSVTFTGPITVRSEEDIQAIVRAVERAIATKGQMLGLRAPAY